MCVGSMLASVWRGAVSRSLLVVAAGAGCGSALLSRPGFAQTAAPSAAAPSAAAPSAAAPSAAAPLPGGAEAERTVTLDAVLRVALERNPELNEAKLRSRAARELAPALSRWPDPEIEYQLWAQPLARPWALDEAQMHMLGVRQTIPAPGTLSGRTEAANARADGVEQSYRARRLELVTRVRRAYAAYYLADREYRLHTEHAGLAQQVTELASAMYRAGRGTQQDVLRAGFELSRLHGALIQVGADRDAARALLNTLMGLDPEAALGAPADRDIAALRRRAAGARVREERPELAVQRNAIKAEERELSATRAAGRWPTFMVGAQYMYMPTTADHHNYGVTLSMSLPWFNPRYAEEVRAAQARLAAERSALQSVELTTRYETYAARRRAAAAERTLDQLEKSLLPEAQRSFESAQAGYRGGQLDSMALLDALRTLLDVRTERERAQVELELAVAELDRTTGTSPGSESVEPQK